ncbi:multidrug and toxin extrusion protein 2-like isoform X2 [Hyperolius riggenbachi]|uniref:multidrug and toxin extrusion protein 2-like isoform X2 n=1 Tax=Hyperolius riggenbachi TaxID=752182 RepID=UPI0035A329E7
MIRWVLPVSFWDEVRELCRLALPVVINVTGLSVGIGLSSACDTLVSQTYGGRNLKRVGTILQRGILILLLCCFPCWAVFLNTEQLLLLCKQDPDVARLTQTYVMIFIPALPAAFLYQLQTRYLQNQNIIWPQVITGLAVNIINVALNAIFMYALELGVEGSALANTLSNFAMSGLLLIYIIVKKLYVSTWGGWSRDCLQEWDSFIHLAIPSMLMVCLEWWSFEIGGFLAGLLSITELGAQAIILQLATAAYMVAVGLGGAATVRIGTALGAGDVEQAQTSCKAVFLCIALCSLVTVSVLAGLKDVIAYVFTSDREIATLVSQAMLIFVPFHLCDSIAGTCGGILRGTGKQYIGAVANAIGFYLLGLPIGISLMFAAKLGVQGFWIGLMFTVFLQASFFMVYIYHMNWDKSREEAQIHAGLKIKDEKLMCHGPKWYSSITSLDMAQNGNTGHSVMEKDLTSSVIAPDNSCTEHLLLQNDTPLETTNVVGAVLSTKQLILRRGSAVLLAVIVLLVGVAVRILTVKT